MSIPIISLILLVLMRYASRQPKKEDTDREQTQSSISETPSDKNKDRDKGPLIRNISGENFNFNNQSVFGKAISRGVTGERAEAFSSSSEMAYFAYAGAEKINTYLSYL